MDVVDIFLSLAKMLKYCGFQTLCDIMFIVFMVAWIILRHVAYNYIFYFSWSQSRDIMQGNCDQVGPDAKMCYTDRAIDFFLLLLGGLQVITLVWMYLILKVAYKVISGSSADDVRSDSEDTVTEDEFEAETDEFKLNEKIDVKQYENEKLENEDELFEKEPMS
ncbi:unnamed protein product [Ambrosiozyma monospora]|uniref:Unnamed protein product n=1 Tax=Ambrosiozyma monospora TaxID=43982 RepID=A0ACB5T497_AMBMO|nr:unnamed protein product [Ambrosiozyma monospora]